MRPCLAAFLASMAVFHGPAFAAPLSDYFDAEPANSLIRQLESGDVDETPAGIALSQKRRWLPELRLLVIENSVTNRGKKPVDVGSLPLARWTFRISGGVEATRYGKLTYRNDTWYGSTFWTGPDWTRVGKDWHHPGENTPSVRRFTAPRDGRVTISGRVHKAHLDGDGVRVSIRHNGRTLWTADIQGKDDRGVEPKLTLDVRKGDSIRFVVHKLGAIFCDTTRWDPVITYADGSKSRASENFSTTDQGRGGWSYEMELDPADKSGFPRILAMDRDLAPRDEPLVSGRPVESTDRDSLPLLVVADEADESGIAMAVVTPGAWRLRSMMTDAGLLDLRLDTADGRILAPGRATQLPTVVLGAYRGPSTAGMKRLQQILASGNPDARIGQLKTHVAAAMRGLTSSPDFPPDATTPATILPELDLGVMVLAGWRLEDKIEATAESYATATAVHLRKGRLLLADLRAGRSDEFLAAEAVYFDRLAELAARDDLDLARRRALYYRVRLLKRHVAFSNPLLNFGKLLFCKRVPTAYSHLVMQYFGWRARPGGGLFVLERPGFSLACHDILQDKLQHGNVLEPRLSYDGRRVVFSFVNCGKGNIVPAADSEEDDGTFYHLYEVNVDGSGLRQLTRGPFDDTMPVYLPDGGIAMSSTRRGGYARCFGAQFGTRAHIYTIHRCDGDGGNLRTLSFHDTNEWFPTVSNTGRILYARWDYIDRDAVTHQNLWAMRPDGTNPISVWGNATPAPHCSFQAKAIPGSSKLIFTASAHHSITAGTICLVDPTAGYDGLGAVTRITPEIPFPEAESRAIDEYYTAPWPLSEDYYLVGYSPTPLAWEPHANARAALGIYLLDRFGNRELIYRDAEIGSTNPTPLVARPVPPIVSSELDEDSSPTGEVLLMDVYRGLGDVPRDHIRALRVIQVFPKTTPLANNPRMGVAGEENGRAILGTVPVEADGSARFLIPAHKPVLFQALDGDGFAYQTMRTVTYVQPGERVSCVGCHENRMTAPVEARPMALRRGPSVIDPGALGGRPFSFAEMVQPVLDRHCVRCHGGEKTEGKIDLTPAPEASWTKSYVSLTRDAKLVPRFPARNQIQVTPPGGRFGALGSGLIGLLREGHEDVKLSPEDLRRLAAWIDCNAIFYGTPDPIQQARQREGLPVPMPQMQ